MEGPWLDFWARLQGVQFTGEPFNWKPGFYVRTVEGISDGGRVRHESLARSRGPGVLRTPARREDPRAIILKGFAYADSQSTMREQADQFAGILDEDDEFAVFDFREFGEPRWVNVQRDGEWPFVPRRRRNGYMDWTMVLRAPDQRIYGDQLETTGWGSSVTVTNRGATLAPVRIRIRGTAVGGYTITGPRGRRAVVTRALAAGQEHEYDADTGILRVAGAAVDTGVTVSDVLEIPPGTHTVTVSAGAEVLVNGHNTYMP